MKFIFALRKKLRLFFVLFLLVPAIHSYSQSYNIHNFKTEDGIAQSYVYSISQDKHGYLWVGTGNGLSRYNGFTFENYTTSDSLGDNLITCGISDGKYQWFGHMNGRLSFFNGKIFQAVSLPLADLGPITHFTKSPDENLWLSTYSGVIFKLSKNSGWLKAALLKDQGTITSFEFINLHELLIGTNTGLWIAKLKESGEIENTKYIEEIPPSKIVSIKKMKRKSGFYIATEGDGIFCLTSSNNLIHVSKINTDSAIEFNQVQDILEDTDSNLWICTFGKGLIKLSRFDSEKFSKIDYFNTSNGFVTDNIKTIYEDQEGTIWSGNFGDGLTQVTKKELSIRSFDKQKYGGAVFSTCISGQNQWVGTEKGLLKIDQLSGKVIKFYSKESGLPRDTVTSIYSDDEKALWVGTERNGVYRLENEKSHKYPMSDGTLENSITSITGKGNQIWIGTKKGLCNINSHTNIQKWYSIHQGGLPHNYINCLYFDSKKRLWVATRSNILAYIENDKIVKLPLISGNRMFTISSVTEDSNLKIWVGSNGDGVFMIGTDSIINLTTKEGLLSNYCYSIINDNNNNLWVGHKGGLSKIRINDFNTKAIQHFESITDNYQFNPNAIQKDQKGTIRFGSDKGIVSYDPSSDLSDKLPAPVLEITSIRINGETTNLINNITLSPGNYKITIGFLGISLKEPTLVSYQYQLQGYEPESEITKNNSVTYNHVSEGKYNFILKASRGDGKISVPQTITIFIKKPMWKIWWVYFIGILIVLIFAFIYVKQTEYEFTKEKKNLEKKVAERTFEIQNQKYEIELQRDIIAEKNESITSSIHYARNIQNAVLSSKELINKLLPDSFFFSKPKDIVSGDFYWVMEKNEKIIFAVADCTGHGVPGAFMSLLGITLLNEIVTMEGITKSDAIVTKLRSGVIQALHQDSNEFVSFDGMDIGLCVLDKDKKTVQFTGGIIKMIFIRDGKLEVISGDRFSVTASEPSMSLKDFTMKDISFLKGDMIYLYTDGYQDQFDEKNEKKYLSRRLCNSLLDIHQLPVNTQKEILEKRLNDWMKDNIQTDDITLVGIRL